jgi:PhnB protein
VIFHPYLNFGGNCAEAFQRYHEILGGELEIMMMSDLPPGEGDDLPPGAEKLVMHAALKVDDTLLMASDDPTGGFEGNKGTYVSLTVDSIEDADRIYAALAEGGEEQMPIGEVFWSPRWGMCLDRFGVPWMVGVDAPQEQAQAS